METVPACKRLASISPLYPRQKKSNSSHYHQEVKALSNKNEIDNVHLKKKKKLKK